MSRCCPRRTWRSRVAARAWPGPRSASGRPPRSSPRSRTIRSTCTSSGTSTTITASKSPARPFSASSGMSCTTTASAGASRLELDDPLEDQGVDDRLEPPAGSGVLTSPNTSRPIAGRSRSPSGVSRPGPNSSTTAARPGVPARTTSRARASASMTTAPSSREDLRHGALARRDPPVSPIRTMRARIWVSGGAQGQRRSLADGAPRQAHHPPTPAPAGRAAAERSSGP